MSDKTRLLSISDNVEWVKAEKGGVIEKFNCPDCSEEMIIIANLTSYAYCLKCKQYWIQKIDFQFG